MATFYKGFLIKQVITSSTIKYSATLQGVRFTAPSVAILHTKIDKNTHMIADMSNQSFKRDSIVNSAMFDPSDNLLDPSEIAEIISQYLVTNQHNHYYEMSI